jgi:membrane protein implicated in regulation of membrane protease activity
VLHALQTLPGMLSVIVGSVFAAIAALAGLAFGAPSIGVIVASALVFVLAMVWLTIWGRRELRGRDPSLEPHFPAPGRE